MNSIRVFLVLAVVSALTTGCASTQSGKVYSRKEARAVQTVAMGVVENVEEVTIEGTKTPVGTVAGAVLGGVMGSAVGGGSGQDIAMAVGAIGGAVLGSAVEEGATRNSAWELTIKMDDGRSIVLVQAKDKDEVFAAGDRVRVITSNEGTVRASK